jgi:tetratricopeptide (TPR) repeat protein
VPGAGAPSVKILDFGLARIADSDIAATTVSEIGVIKGTLQYMSPEQARGDVEAIDLRSDVYGLGVILYEMLTGQRPYDVSLSALAEAVRVICEEPPRPLSRHWSGTRRLDSDLETIVGKALEKDIDCRYGSAAALGEDMDRYLASQPIQARPPSAAYQLKKMVQRNRLGAAFVATVLALLVGFGVTMAAQARRIAAERDRAELVSDFMLELFAFSDTGETRGEEVTAREILDRGVERVEADLAGDPVTQGRLMETMGDVYRNLGLYEPATRLLEGALERSIENTGTTSFDTARIQMGLAWLLVHDAQFERAEEIERQAIETLRARGDQPLYLASALNNLVFGFLRRGGRLPEESLAFLDEALEIQIKYLGEENAEVAGTIFHKAWALSRTGRREEAAAMFRQTIDMQRRIYEGDYPSIAWALNNLSAQETALGNPETGLALATEALEMNHRLFGEFHPEIGFNLKRQADAYQAMHNHQAAAEALRLALEVDRRTLPADHPRIASTLNNLVAVLWNLGDITDARVYLEEAMELSRARRGDDHPSIGVYLNNLAELDLALGDVDSAYERLNRALEIIRSSRGENHPSTIYARGNLARVYRYRGDLEKAEALNLQALEILASQPEHQLQGPLHRQLAEVYLDQGRLDEALAESELAVQIMSEDNATVDWELAVTRNIHGDCLSRTGDLETAGPVLAESTEIIVTTAPGETFGREASGRLAAHRDRAR